MDPVLVRTLPACTASLASRSRFRGKNHRPMRIHSRNGCDDRLDDLDPYFTSAEAIDSLIALEGTRLPYHVWEPAAGDGVPAAGHRPKRCRFRYPRLRSRRLCGSRLSDRRSTAGIEVIATHSPSKRALQFAERKRSVKFPMSPFWYAPISIPRHQAHVLSCLPSADPIWRST